LSQSDPTDTALAAIASILDQQQTPPPLEHAPADESPAAPPPLVADVAEPPNGHGYSKIGPGPMAAIRFKWTVREENGQYFVDETFGENPTPLVSGPMDREAAIQFVDDRESAAHQRFEELKHEMAGRSAAASLTRKDAGEA
jgi:hypothetical protein